MASSTLDPSLTVTAQPRAATQPRLRRTPLLDLSPDAYWLLAIGVVVLYLVLWVTHFDYVYGWSTDDRTVFAKGIATVATGRTRLASSMRSNPISSSSPICRSPRG